MSSQGPILRSIPLPSINKPEQVPDLHPANSPILQPKKKYGPLVVEKVELEKALSLQISQLV